MAFLNPFVMTEDVYRQIGELINVDLGKGREAVIRLQVGSPVVVDILGISPKRSPTAEQKACPHRNQNQDRHGEITCSDCGAVITPST